MQNKVFFLIILSISLIGSTVSAETFGYGRTESVPINYSIIPTVNNSEYFDGFSVTSLYTYYRGLLETYFGGVYCKLTGCTMTGDLVIDGYVNATGMRIGGCHYYNTTATNDFKICNSGSGECSNATIKYITSNVTKAIANGEWCT